MKKVIWALMLGLMVGMVGMGWAFTDDFEGGNPWTDNQGSVNISITQNHTTGGMYSMLGVATFSAPAVAYRQETSAAVGESWTVTGWIFRNGGTVQFGWNDHTLSNQSGSTNTWVQVTDTITFSTGATFDVKFFVSGTGTQAYLDDVVTSKNTPVTDWALYE